jgi:glutamine synthetase
MSLELLSSLNLLFKEKWNYTICLGAEIEFHIFGSDSIEQIFAEIYAKLSSSNIACGEIEQEKGRGQHEIQLGPTTDPVKLVQDIVTLRNIISLAAKRFGATASFAAKPIADDYGNALHIHLNLLKSSNNIFAKLANGEESVCLLHALAGLLLTLNEAMFFFAPYAESYARYAPYFDAPTNISWGGNNRTTSLRLPTSDYHNRRIEHRLSASDADPTMVIIAMLIGVYHGICHKLTPPPRIYGNAYDPQYQLEPLATSLVQAELMFMERGVVKGYIGELTIDNRKSTP